MVVILLLTGLALAIFAMAVSALVWSVRQGQYDDLDTPALRMLGDDPPPDRAPPHDHPRR